MRLRVVGAGLGRTGTHSLKVALERLLGGRCYHMSEAFDHPEHVPLWRAALRGSPDWDALLGDYVAAVDWPAVTFWRELAAANPDAPVVLSLRDDAQSWWRSAEQTILAAHRDPAFRRRLGELGALHEELFDRFGARTDDREGMIAAYEAHNAAVRREVPAARLVEWRPGDGWAPVAAALGVDAPDEPFPHVSTTADFREMTGLGRA